MGSYIFGILDWDRKILVSRDLKIRFGYLPLFVKMSSHSFPRKRPGRIKDRTRETTEIERILK